MKKLSIIVPCYNEEESIPLFYSAVQKDSIKDLIRYWEHKGGYDKTFLYFAPTED